MFSRFSSYLEFLLSNPYLTNLLKKKKRKKNISHQHCWQPCQSGDKWSCPSALYLCFLLTYKPSYYSWNLLSFQASGLPLHSCLHLGTSNKPFWPKLFRNCSVPFPSIAFLHLSSTSSSLFKQDGLFLCVLHFPRRRMVHFCAAGRLSLKSSQHCSRAALSSKEVSH